MITSLVANGVDAQTAFIAAIAFCAEGTVRGGEGRAGAARTGAELSASLDGFATSFRKLVEHSQQCDCFWKVIQESIEDGGEALLASSSAPPREEMH